MPRLGIVMVRMIKRRRWYPFNKISVKEAENGSSHMIAEIQVREGKLEAMSRKRRRKLLSKAERLLSGFGADRILIDSEYKEVLLSEPQKPKNLITPYFCFDAFGLAVNKVGGKRIGKLTIYDSEMRAACMSRIENLVMSVRSISLYTDKAEEAERIADGLLLKYGILIDVMPMSGKNVDVRPKYLIDVDNGRVCAEDFVVDGIELDADMGECQLDNTDLTDNIGIFGALNIKKLISGKNSIEVSER